MSTGQSPQVKTAAHLTKSIVYNNREQLSAGLIVAGYDKVKGGQVSLWIQFLNNFKFKTKFKVYVVPLGGMIFRKSIITGGSGSIYIMGFLDANYREGMTKEEAIALAKHGTFLKINFFGGFFWKVFFWKFKIALELAISRDGSSGGCIRIAAISEQGVERDVVLNNDVPRFYEK